MRYFCIFVCRRSIFFDYSIILPRLLFKNNDTGRVLEVRVMFNSTFSNISDISLQSVLLNEKTEKLQIEFTYDHNNDGPAKPGDIYAIRHVCYYTWSF